MQASISASGNGKVGGSWAIFCLAIAGSAWFSVRLGQDISWDLRNYHYYAGFAFLHKPLDYDFAPAQVQSFFNPLQHVLSYLLLTWLPAKLVAIVLGAVQGLNFYLVFQISQHLLLLRLSKGPRYILSLCNAAAGFYGTANVIELGTTMGDNLYSILILTAILLILRHLISGRAEDSRKTLALGLAGCLLGFAFALKLTAVVYISAIGLILAVLLPLTGTRFRILMVLYAGLACGFAAGYGIWGAHLYRQYKSPVYPYLNNIFRSPYYDLDNTMDARFKPRNREEVLFYPFFFTVKNGLINEMPFREVRFALCYIAVFGVTATLLFRWFRAGTWTSGSPDLVLLVFLTALFAVSYAVWQYLFSILRYLIVLELLAPSFLALTAVMLFRRGWMAILCSVTVNFAICAAVIPTDFGRQQKFDNNFLKVQVPAFPGLDRSLVVMAGDEPTAYIAARFPETTRFAKLNSNYYFPGRNEYLDRITRGIVSKYDVSQILAYVSGSTQLELMRETLRFYGLHLLEQHRWDMGREGRTEGYLYNVAPDPKPVTAPAAEAALTVPQPRPVPIVVAPVPIEPAFLESDTVRLTVEPAEAVAGNTLTYTVFGLQASAVDVMYSVNGKAMPPIRRWQLGKGRQVSISISPATTKGDYHILAIRDSYDPRANTWYRVDVHVQVR
jgi:hypothetical protein